MFGLRPAQRVKADRFALRVLKKRRLYGSRRAKLTILASLERTVMIGRFGSIAPGRYPSGSHGQQLAHDPSLAAKPLLAVRWPKGAKEGELVTFDEKRLK
jgi:hypothetical protein